MSAQPVSLHWKLRLVSVKMGEDFGIAMGLAKCVYASMQSRGRSLLPTYLRLGIDIDLFS